MTAVKINPQIFREYDVRGTVGKDLSDEFAYLLGRAYGELVRESKGQRVAIGHDCRLSSPGYARELARGIAEEGVHVIHTGMGPTPQLYFSIFTLNTDGGIQVTGSHNPSDMNGFKICLGKMTLSGQQIQELRARVERLNGKPATHPTRGTISEQLIQKTYIDTLVENSRSAMGKRKLRVVVDAGNGVGGMVGPAVLRRLGIEVIELFCEPDGRFPNHHPDPSEVKNLQHLIAKVRETKADCGIGWDGDADRIGVVDEQGHILFGDMLLLIYARELLKSVKHPTVIGDVKCSRLLFEDLKKRGANAIMWKTGHSLIKGKLRDTGGELAGEMSGHIFFKHRFYGFDDAIYASQRFVEVLSNTDLAASKLIADLPKMYSTPEIRVDCPEEVKFRIPERAKSLFPGYEVETIDGVRVSFEHGWALVRASNTQPVLVMRFEAESEAYLNEYQTLVTKKLEQVKRELQAA